MRAKYLFTLSLLLIDVSALANEQETSHNTIPFIIYKPQSINQPYYASEPQLQALMPQKFCLSANSGITEQVNMSFDQIKHTIKDVQTEFCNVVPAGTDIRVWFSIDASGKVLGIGTAAQSGLEVTYHCGSKAK